MNGVVFFLQNLAKLCHQQPEDKVYAKNVHKFNWTNTWKAEKNNNNNDNKKACRTIQI